MKIRAHRGGLSESMKTVAEIEPTAKAVAEHVTCSWKGSPNSQISPDMVRVEKYGNGIDLRIGWDTHIVLIEGQGPFGFTDGPLTPNA